MGVLYRLTHNALDRMDLHEQGYRRERVHVRIQNGELTEAVTYIAHPANVVDGGSPSVEYLRTIVRGARQHGLPEEYIPNLIKDQGDFHTDPERPWPREVDALQWQQDQAKEHLEFEAGMSRAEFEGSESALAVVSSPAVEQTVATVPAGRQ